MKPSTEKRPPGDPDPLLRIEVERPLAEGGRLRVVSSIPQKTALWIAGAIATATLGMPVLSGIVRGLSPLLRLFK